WKYDDAGNLTRLAFVGPEDGPFVGHQGYAWAEYSYDAQGSLTGSRYLDAKGNPVRTQVIVLAPLLFSSVRAFTDRKEPPFKRGDVLVGYAGKKIVCARQFFELKRNEDFDREEREVRILREGQAMTVKIPSGPLQLRSSRFIRSSAATPLNPDPNLLPIFLGL